MRLVLSPGNRDDRTRAMELLVGLRAAAVVADKGYDADWLVWYVEHQGAEAVIPPRSNRKVQRGYDAAKYRARNGVERFFGRVKRFRRVSTRYEKKAVNFLSMAHFASSLLLLPH